MRIPNAEDAFVDIRKLRGYALNPEHRVGRHKARLFSALLDMSVDNAKALRDILLEVVRTYDAVLGKQDEHGQRYRIDFTISWHGKRAKVRSAWNVRPQEDFPRLVTCFPLEEAKE